MNPFTKEFIMDIIENCHAGIDWSQDFDVTYTNHSGLGHQISVIYHIKREAKYNCWSAYYNHTQNGELWAVGLIQNIRNDASQER